MPPTPSRRLRSSGRLLPTLASLALAASAVLALPSTALAATGQVAKAQVSAAQVSQRLPGHTYYVTPRGSGDSSGHSKHATLPFDRVTGLTLRPGDRVLLKRGASFHGTLRVTESGALGSRIRVSHYGDPRAKAPSITGGCVDIPGSWVVVAQIAVHDCQWAAIRVGGSHDAVRRNSVSHSFAGIQADYAAKDTLIARNRVFDNRRLAPGTPGPYDDYGAFGVLVNGDRTEVRYNTISGQSTPSPDFVTDGSAVEVYAASGTRVHHNVAHNNRTFTELGEHTTSGTTYDHNVVTSTLRDSEFLVTRGPGDQFGPVAGTVARNNSVRLTGGGTTGVYCWGGCSPATLALWNNVLDVQHAITWTDGPTAGGNNVYWKGYLSTEMMPGDVVADPRFINADIVGAGGNLRLRPGSPAAPDSGAYNG